MLLLVLEDRLEDVGRGDVALGPHHLHAAPQPVDRLDLDLPVRLEHLGDRLPDPHVEQPLVVRQPFEEQDAVGEHFGVPHLVERLGAGVGGELRPAEVLLHLGVQEVLVDGGQLGGQLLVEELDDLGVALHGGALLLSARLCRLRVSSSCVGFVHRLDCCRPRIVAPRRRSVQ